MDLQLMWCPPISREESHRRLHLILSMGQFNVKAAAEKVICVAIVSTKPTRTSTILVSGRIVRLSEKYRNFFFERVERWIFHSTPKLKYQMGLTNNRLQCQLHNPLLIEVIPIQRLIPHTVAEAIAVEKVGAMVEEMARAKSAKRGRD